MNEQWLNECKDRFELSPSSPSGLINACSCSQRAPKGSPAGYLNNGRYKVTMGGKQYPALHVVAALGDVEGWQQVRDEVRLNPRSQKLCIRLIDNTLPTTPDNLVIGEFKGFHRKPKEAKCRPKPVSLTQAEEMGILRFS